MSVFQSELSGSLLFRSGSATQASLVPAADTLKLTGSLHITGSSLLFNGSDLINRLENIEAGSGDAASLGPINRHTESINTYTASNDIDSASFDSRLDLLETTSSNQETSITSLNAATSSYVATANDVIALGFAQTASSNLISSSTQIADLGYVTSSVAEIPAGTLSSSAQVLELGFLTGSPEGTISSSGQLDTLGYLTSESAAAAGFGSGGGSIPAGTVSSSQQIEDLGYLTSASAASAGFGSGGASIPAGTISSSAQIADLGYVTSSAAASIPDGTISSSQQIEDLGFDTGSSAFDGARIISNEDLGDLFSNSFNPGTSGSIQDFLDAVFYPNSSPSFSSTGSFFASEFATSGSTVGTLTATDPEGQALTFRTNSAYTDGLVVVASNGTITLTQSPTGGVYNTVDRGDGVLAHEIQVDAVDSFGTFTTSTIYIVVDVNQPPVFRQTSIAGNIITSFTANRNENEGATEVGKIYFTDPEGDTITIASSSISNGHFTLTKYSNYVQIDQATGSLDFEDTTSYEFSITASDEHYEAGDDLQASASLLITINVTDNVIPVVNDQTLGSINENSSNGATIGTIAASDAESDTITFQNFTLDSLELDGGAVSTGTYGGTEQLTDPHEDPFQMTSTGTVTRKSGIFLNSDLVNTYKYSVQVVDQFNTASDSGIITININDDTPATISDNWSAGPYIIESAVANDQIRIGSNGRTGTQARLTANQSGAWTSSNAAVNISQTGYLTIANNISGSLTGSGDTISSTITFRNTFKTVTTEDITIQVAANDAPDASFTDLTSNLNTNLATASANIVEGTITDDEGDTPYLITLSGTNASDLEVVYLNANSSSFNIQAVSTLTAGDYFYTASVFDNFDKSTVYNRSFTINESGLGALTTNGTFYVIESAVNGDNIVLNSNGRTGTQGDIGVTYSPNYGSQAVASFTSANSMLAVASNGNLTLGANLSGSLTQSGDTFTSEITWDDQYGNTGSGSVTINVTTNAAPDVAFSNTSANLNTNLGRSGSTLTTISFTDTEGDTILYDEFNGTEDHGLNFKRSGNTYLVQPTGSLEAGSYTISGSIVDEHGFSTNEEGHDFTIAQADIGTLSTNGTFYVIESAETNNPVVTNSNGRTGTTGSLSVSYSPAYGSPAVASFTSSNDSIDIDDSTGEITLLANISGSTTGSGDTITSDITFRDQYDNVGSGSITINVTANQPPTVVTFTDITANLTASIASGTGLVSMSISDTENNTPFSASLSGTDASKLKIDYLNADSSSAVIKADETLSAGTLNYNVRVTDNFDKFTDYTGRTLIIASEPFSVYGYGISWAANPSSEAQFIGTAGDAGGDGVGINSGSIIAHLQSGSIGGTFSTSYGAAATVTLYHSSSTMTSMDDNNGGNGISSLGYFNFSGGSQHVLIVFPSSSALGGKPASMYDGVPPDSTGTDNEFYLYAKDAAIPGTLGAGVYYFDTETSVQGSTRWGMIYSEGKNTNNSRAFLMPDSASAP